MKKLDTTGMEVITLAIDQIKPYSNNPRINTKSIKLLEESIQRYGFLVPITVDKDHVIVTGHSRYSAARNLDLKELPVIVLDLPDLKIREYRIADNKVGEFSELDFNLKGADIANYVQDDDLMAMAFPDFKTDDEDTDDGEVDMDGGDEEPVMIDCICPDCLHEFEVNSAVPYEEEEE